MGFYVWLTGKNPSMTPEICQPCKEHHRLYPGGLITINTLSHALCGRIQYHICVFSSLQKPHSPHNTINTHFYKVMYACGFAVSKVFNCSWVTNGGEPMLNDMFAPRPPSADTHKHTVTYPQSPPAEVEQIYKRVSWLWHCYQKRAGRGRLQLLWSHESKMPPTEASPRLGRLKSKCVWVYSVYVFVWIRGE